MTARTYTLPEPPSANRWWRKFRNRMVLSMEAKDYIAHVRSVIQAKHLIPKTIPVAIRIIWYRGRKAGDLDKRLGVLLDALQGVAYVSDAQIVEIEAARIDVPKSDAKVEVTIWEVP